MSFIESILDRTKRMEGLLARNYNATGRGLHEKITSVESLFDESTVKQARYIASVRNAIMHEDDYTFDGDEEQFLSLCDRLIERFNNPTTRPEKLPQEQPRSSTSTRTHTATSSYQPPLYIPPQIHWYRSTLFLFITFFFFPPLWFILILTDHSKGCFTKLLAGVWVLGVCSTLIWPIFLLPAYFSLPQNQRNMPTPLSPPTTPRIPKDAPFLEVPPASIPQTDCTIQWIEFQNNDWAGKNRSMVWEEFVSKQVSGSGMTEKQFYKQVLEQNPTMIDDNYVFMKDKIYLLPVCK